MSAPAFGNQLAAALRRAINDEQQAAQGWLDRLAEVSAEAFSVAKARGLIVELDPCPLVFGVKLAAYRSSGPKVSPDPDSGNPGVGSGVTEGLGRGDSIEDRNLFCHGASLPSRRA